VAQAVVVWTAAYMAFIAVLSDVKIDNVVIGSNPLPLPTGPPPGRWTPGLCGHGRWWWADGGVLVFPLDG
jgi:hypothetical protein